MDIRLKCHRSSDHRCFAKKLLLKILQYSQENTCFFNKVAGLHNFLDTYYKITVIRKLANGSLWKHEHESMQKLCVFINYFLQQATWLKRRNSTCIFAVGRALVPTQEEKTICSLVERIYLIIVSREGNHAQFESLSKMFESFNVMGCIPTLQPVYGHAKKGIIYAWIVHCWIVNHWIAYCELPQPEIFLHVITVYIITVMMSFNFDDWSTTEVLPYCNTAN